MSPLIVFKDIKTFFQMLRAIVGGHYKVPWATFGWIMLCLVYFVSPIDALPDILPILGFADDGAFLIFVLLLLHKELAAFRNHQINQQTIIEAEIIEGEKHD